MKKWIWQTIHNAVAHPLLVTNTVWAEKFHSWTSEKGWPSEEYGYEVDSPKVKMYEYLEGIELSVEYGLVEGREEEVLDWLEEVEKKACEKFHS